MKRTGSALVLLLLLGLACGRSTSPAIERGVFPRPARPVAAIVSPAYSEERKRDEAGEAERVMDRLGIKPGVRVADIGAGEGYYAVRLARRLGPGATLYATDVQPTHLARLGERLQREDVSGVTLVLGAPRDPRLPPRSIDVVILSHVYHEIENAYEFLYRLQPAVAAGGRVGIIEIDRSTESHGTPPALLRCELAAVGYREVDLAVLTPADGYLAVFEPPAKLPAIESIGECPP